MRVLIGILTRELDVLELGSKIQSDVRSEIDKGQREYFLRQQMQGHPAGARRDQRARGRDHRAAHQDRRAQAARRGRQGGAARARAAGQHLAAERRVPGDPHLPRLDRRPCRGRSSSDDNLDVPHAREILDRDHYDLEKVKDRILEFLAVRKLKADLHGPILCFVGPPGVGKTSLGQSIAEAMGRKFERISVGGVRDEAEIRGHRRTYVGAMPGIIVRAMRDAGTNNPVFMLDEIDKMGADFRGDPGERPARSARPRAERHLPRSLPGPAVRPLQGAVHHHGQPARAHPGAAARPHGDHRPRRLHHRGEAAHRARTTWCRGRSTPTASGPSR